MEEARGGDTGRGGGHDDEGGAVPPLPNVRKASIIALQNLYEVDDNVPSLGLFTERFSNRMIELADDVDISVSVCAIGLIKQLLRHQLPNEDDLGSLYDLLIDDPPEIINPATEEIIGNIPAASVEDVDLAVEVAKRALSRNRGKDWASAPGAHRAKYLRAIANKIRDRKTELATLESMDCGKPLDEALWDIDDVAACFDYYADLAEGLDTKQKTLVSLPMDTFKCHVVKEPIGVVGLITPWNYPLLMATWKVAPALAAGCAAILKPSEVASVTCLELAAVCKDVGLPPGILNVLTEQGYQVRDLSL